MATRFARRRFIMLTVVLQLTVSLLGLSAPTNAASVRAMLGEQEIAVQDVTRYHCHDADYPVLRCFSSARDASAGFNAALRRGGTRTSTTLETSAITYIRVFVHSVYQGSSIYLSQNYDNLTSIGWNDVISSYKAMNSQSGTMYENAFMDGRIENFCCNASVSYIGDFMNDRTSSIEN